MHDAVTNTPPSNMLFSSDDVSSSVQPKHLSPAAKEMVAPAPSRRIQLPTQNGGGRWKQSGVDPVAPEWNLANEIARLQINDANGPLHDGSPQESSSEPSVNSSSPVVADQSGLFASHSRGSSADTSHSSHSSAKSQTLKAAPITPLKMGVVGESRNRPHSYSGGLSSADLTRLQQTEGSPGTKGDAWQSPNGTPDRQAQPDQPTYPSLVTQGGTGEDFQVDYSIQQRRFSPLGQGAPAAQFPSARPPNVVTSQPFRPPRGYNPQMPIPGAVPSPNTFAYPPQIPPSMPLSNPQQQLYEMMLPTPPLENPTMARLQQQHSSFRPGHQHSASDPASLRDATTLALINSSMQAFAAGQMYPPAIAPPPTLSMFGSQFYAGPQDAFPSPELTMMARLQAQYTGPYGVPVQSQSIPLNAPATQSDGASSNVSGTGPSANNRKLGLYKTELCRSWEEKGTCRYGTKCQFAHGEDELRRVQRHPKYKTEICRTFWVSGSCPYGKRCCFIHTELPASGAPPGAEGAPPPSNPDGRTRSASTNSDPNEGSTSLLARISAKRTQEGSLNPVSGNVSTTPPSAGVARPGALRVDTSVIDTATHKQNKSAYPTFAHNGILMHTNEEGASRSPGPVTAAPDFGRHAAARMDIVGTQMPNNTSSRHSYSGSDVQLDLNNSATPTAGGNVSSFGVSSPDTTRSTRVNGHVRSGSAGNWGNATRGPGHLTAYPLSSIPGGELKNSPWADYNSGSRMAEKTWV